jgi:2',3'-cyclic-nucleotide 2'-phosphodiesterase
VTSEKVAMGWHLDGRVAACLGTHTHVPTADARILPGGTAFISDVGMTGSRAGVIGIRREQALERFRTQMPVKFDTADEDVWINAVAIAVRADGLAESIEQVLIPAPD